MSSAEIEIGQPVAPAATPTPARRSSRLAVAATCLGAFIAFVDVTVVNTAFPDIARGFRGASLGELSWIVNAYTIPFAALLLPIGRLADLVGRRKVFVLGVAVFTIASAAAALAPSLGLLIAARALQGAAAAAMVPTSLALLLPQFSLERQPMAIGIWGATNALASALGPAAGGSLVEISDWRLVFLVNVPIGVATIALTLRSVDERKTAVERRLPDLAGTLALATGIALFVLAVVEGERWGWLGATTIITAVGGIAFAAISLVRSFRHPVPAIETSLWRIRGVAVTNFTSLLAGAAFFGFILGGSLMLVTQWHYSVLDAGLAMTLGALASGVAAPFSGVVGSRYGDTPVIVIGGAVFAAACAWIAFALPAQPDYLSFWMPVTMLAGAGMGFLFPGLSSASVKGVAEQRLGAAIALNMTTRQIGGAFGVACTIALLSASQPTIDTYALAAAGSGVVAAAVSAITLGAAALRRARGVKRTSLVAEPPRPVEAAVALRDAA